MAYKMASSAVCSTRSPITSARVEASDLLSLTIEGSGNINVEASSDIVMKGPKILQN